MSPDDTLNFLTTMCGNVKVDWQIEPELQPCMLDQNIYEALGQSAKGPINVFRARSFTDFRNEIKNFGESLIRIQLGDDVFEVTCLVASLPSAHGILGMGFMSSVGCSLNLDEGYLDIRGHQYICSSHKQLTVTKII